MSIGSRIKQRREELGLTQPELAKLIGVSKGSIGNYESGVSSPNEKILFKLFSALKCDANFLYQDDIKITEAENFTCEEKEHIKKYRSLDDHGKYTVNTVLDDECERMQLLAQIQKYIDKLSQIQRASENEYVELPVAARSKDTDAKVVKVKNGLTVDDFESLQGDDF